MTPGAEIAAALAGAAQQQPSGVLVVERAASGELVVAWANPGAATQLGAVPGSTLAATLGPETAARWDAMCLEAATAGQSIIRNGTRFTSTGQHVVIELRETAGDPALEALLAHNVSGVFIAKLEQPIEWGPHVDREAAIEYAFRHQRVAAVNDALCAQLRATRQELVGSTSIARWGAQSDAWRRHMWTLYEQGHTHHVVRAPRNDGTWLDAEGEYVCIYDAVGRIAGHYGVQRDVTQRRATAEALAKTQERLALAIKAGGVAGWDIDLAAGSIYFDTAWLEQLGYDATAVRWSDLGWWRSIMHDDDLPEAARCFREHLAGRTTTFRLEHRLRTASGAWRWLLSTAQVTLRDAQGRAQRISGTTLDITERKELHARLAASERLAALGTLAASVGHEINNPLTYVVINLARIAQLFEPDAAPPVGVVERARPLVEQAREGAERVKMIVRDLQALSRTPDDKITPVDPIEILERCLRIAEHEIVTRARIVRELAPVAKIAGNEGRLVQLFLNLIVNAAQAIEARDTSRGEIRVVTRETPDGRVQIAISDNGRGIAAEDVEHIFEPFYTTKASGEGTGLGLTIARSIVAAMGGEIAVDTVMGRGTTFTVTLLRADAEVAAPAGRARSPSGERMRILLVDDEAAMGRTLAAILEPHEVTFVPSAREALDRVQGGGDFDLILCDLMMPQVSGMDFFEMLDPALRPRVVFLTGGAFTERASRFLRGVPNRVLRKPFDVDQLMALLGSAPPA